MNPLDTRAKISRKDFLYVMGGAAIGMILARIPRIARRASAQALPQLRSVLETTSPPREYSYLLYTVGSLYKAKNLTTDTIDYSDSAADVVVNNAITALSPNGGRLIFAPETYVINNPIIFPAGSNNPQSNRWIVEGRLGSTTIQSAKNSPNLANRFMFECVAAPGSGRRASIQVKNLIFTHPYWSGFSMGGIKIGSDTSTLFGDILLEKLVFIYCNSGLNVQGKCSNALFSDMNFADFDSHFAGTYDIRVEKGPYSDKPDLCVFENIHNTHLGRLDNCIFLNSNYSTLTHLKLDGWTYNLAPIEIEDGTANNFLDGIFQDLNGQSSTAVGTIYVHQTGIDNCYGNRFENIRAPGYSAYNTPGPAVNVYIDGGAQKNYFELENYGDFNSMAINEMDGDYNVYVIKPGSDFSEHAQAKPTIFQLGVHSRIIDLRANAVSGGMVKKNGTGITTQFSWPHNLYATPGVVTVDPASPDAKGSYFVTSDATNITVTFESVPATGTNNISFYWEAKVYAQ